MWQNFYMFINIFLFIFIMIRFRPRTKNERIKRNVERAKLTDEEKLHNIEENQKHGLKLCFIWIIISVFLVITGHLIYN